MKTKFAPWIIAATLSAATLPFVAQADEHGAPDAAHETGQYISDSAITTKVKAALLADHDLDGMNIHVETNHGVVTLTGAADSHARKELAEAKIKNMDGVKAVDNNLAVKPH